MEEIKQLAKQKAQKWLEQIVDPDVKLQIRKLLELSKSNNQSEQELFVDAFYKDIDFGTGGLRGLMGIGSNRVNSCTFNKVTNGLINFCNKQFINDHIKVAIAYDTRNNSKLYAEQTAILFAQHGIEVFLFSQPTPTPVLSFTVRKYSCQIGIVITASHNPKEYNGYKVYFGDGGQIVPPHDKAIISEVNQIQKINCSLTTLEYIKDDSIKKKIKIVDEEVKHSYQNQTVSFINQLLPTITEEVDLSISIVFSTIHGTGGSYIVPGLKSLGFSKLHAVKEQSELDGNFPTVVYPNPEEEEALTLGLKEMDKQQADVLMATDPDADRIGVAIRNQNGKKLILNGNQIGLLLADFVLELYKKFQHKLHNPYIVRTIVTTSLIDDIAEYHEIEVLTVLTGFKYIGELMTKYEKNRDFIFGLEESHGYLASNLVRDKDAVSSAYLFALMAGAYRTKKLSVYDRLVYIYQKFGFSLERLFSLTKTGSNGQLEIAEMMKQYRESYGRENAIKIIGEDLIYFRDYQEGIELNVVTGERQQLTLPPAKVIQLETKEKSIITIRPSGTEPKIKFYFSVRTGSFKEGDIYAEVESHTKYAKEKINQLIKLFIKE